MGWPISLYPSIDTRTGIVNIEKLPFPVSKPHVCIYACIEKTNNRPVLRRRLDRLPPAQVQPSGGAGGVTISVQASHSIVLCSHS